MLVVVLPEGLEAWKAGVKQRESPLVVLRSVVFEAKFIDL